MVWWWKVDLVLWLILMLMIISIIYIRSSVSWHTKLVISTPEIDISVIATVRKRV